MTDIAKIIGDISTVSRVDKHYESIRDSRMRLGLSQAGHKCPRYLWYCHHGYVGSSPEGRVLRLFQLGNLLEDQTILDLRQAGFNVHSQQKEVKIEYNDITLHGSIDGIVEGLIESPKTPHLFEHKTASKKKYDELIKTGSYRKWSEGYYWQVQFYMLGLQLNRAAVFVYCKDDSRLYMERIKLNRANTIDKLQDVFGVIALDDPPERYCPSEDFFEAKFCQFYEECWRI
jgi:CRISPR/Cas system-associated exonuclease Cas4 (RecB family)